MTRSERIQQRQARASNRRGGMDAQLRDEGQYYEDLGIRMSKSGRKAYEQNESDYNRDYGEMSDQLSTAEGQLKTAKGKLSAADKQLKSQTKKVRDINLEGLWKKEKKNLVKVNVWGANNKTEGTYLLPKDAVKNMHSKTFNQGDGSFTGGWDGDEYVVGAIPRGGSDGYGKELHGALGDGQSAYKSKWESIAEPEMTSQQSKALGQLSNARDTLKGEWSTYNDAYSNISGNRDLLTSGYEQRALEKGDLGKDFAEKKAARGKALAGAIS